jgi:hypothetical protein
MPHHDATPARIPNRNAPSTPLRTGTFDSLFTEGTRAPRPYEQAALAGALDDGLMPDEVTRILAGRRMAEAFPVRWGESPEAYASRAVSEMFVAYLQ